MSRCLLLSCCLFVVASAQAQMLPLQHAVPPSPQPGEARELSNAGVYGLGTLWAGDPFWTPQPAFRFDPGVMGARSAVGWPMPGNDPACTHSTVAAGPVLGLQNWSYSGANVYVWRPSVAPDGTIYVCTARLSSGVDGRLRAIQPNGTLKWEVPLTNAAGAGVWASATPTLDGNGNIYIAWAHDYDFYGLTALSFNASGNFRWRFEPNIDLEHMLHQEPVLANGVLYAAMDTSWRGLEPEHVSSIFALDPADGHPLWRWPSPNLDTFFDGPAVGSDGAVYLASGSNPARNAHGFLYRVLPNGTLDWSRDLGWNGSNATPALDEQNNIYIGDLGGVAWKFTQTGDQKWTYDTLSGRIYTTLGLSAGQVLIGAAYGGLQIVDAAAGTLIRTLAPSFYPLNKAADRLGNVYFYCYDGPGSVFGFSRGGTQWFVQTTGSGVSVNGIIIGDNGQVLVGNSNKLVVYTGKRQGDANCDGVVDFLDINPFVLALSDPQTYQTLYPGCFPLNDINGDGRVDFEDINPFVAVLSGP